MSSFSPTVENEKRNSLYNTITPAEFNNNELSSSSKVQSPLAQTILNPIVQEQSDSYLDQSQLNVTSKQMQQQPRRLIGSILQQGRVLEIGEPIARKKHYYKQNQNQHTLNNTAIDEIAGSMQTQQHLNTQGANNTPSNNLLEPTLGENTITAGSGHQQSKDTANQSVQQYIQDPSQIKLTQTLTTGVNEKSATPVAESPNLTGYVGQAIRDNKGESSGTARKPVFEIRGKSNLDQQEPPQLSFATVSSNTHFHQRHSSMGMASLLSGAGQQQRQQMNQSQMLVSQQAQLRQNHIVKGPSLSHHLPGVDQKRSGFNTASQKYRPTPAPNIPNQRVQTAMDMHSNQQNPINIEDPQGSSPTHKRMSTAAVVKTPSTIVDTMDYQSQAFTATVGTRKQRKLPMSVCENRPFMFSAPGEARTHLFGKQPPLYIPHVDPTLFQQMYPATAQQAAYQLSERQTKSSERGNLEIFSGAEGGAPLYGDVSLVLSMMSQQRQQLATPFQYPPKLTYSQQSPRYQAQGSFNSPLESTRIRDSKRVEKHYQDKLKASQAYIVKLQDEIARIKDLVKKFLSPEQLNQMLYTNKPKQAQSQQVTERNHKEQLDKLGELTIDMVEGGSIEGKVDKIESVETKREQYDGDTQRNSLISTEQVSQQAIERSDVHQLYQDFFLTDLKQEIQDAQKKATHYRKETLEKMTELDRLKRENADLKKQLNRYRMMIVGQEKRITELCKQLSSATRPTGLYSQESNSHQSYVKQASKRAKASSVAAAQQRFMTDMASTKNVPRSPMKQGDRSRKDALRRSSNGSSGGGSNSHSHTRSSMIEVKALPESIKYSPLPQQFSPTTIDIYQNKLSPIIKINNVSKEGQGVETIGEPKLEGNSGTLHSVASRSSENHHHLHHRQATEGGAGMSSFGKRHHNRETVSFAEDIESQGPRRKRPLELQEGATPVSEIGDILVDTGFVDEFEVKRIRDNLNPVDQILLHSSNMVERLDSFSRYCKQIMDAPSLKMMFNQLRLCLKHLFNYNCLYLMMKAEDLCQIYRKKEHGMIHVLTIDSEKFEGAIPDLKQERDDSLFSSFLPAFSKRDFQTGCFTRTVLVVPVYTKNVKQPEKEDLQMMIQLNGFKGFTYTQIDQAIITIAARTVAGSIAKLKAERTTADSLYRTHNMLDAFRSLLAERNLAFLQYKIKQNFPRLFRFKYTGMLFAEKSATPFNPSEHSLYSIIMDEDDSINADFRLQPSNIIKHSPQAGITGIAIRESYNMIQTMHNNSIVGGKHLRTEITPQLAMNLSQLAIYGQSDKRFSQDVDNYMNIGEIYNILIGPLIDQKGNIRGVLHMINKDGDNGTAAPITEDDKREIAGILPALGEIIRTADEASELSELCCSLRESMNNIVTRTPLEGSEVLGQGHVDLVQLENIVKYTKGQIMRLVQHKRKFAYTDKAVCMTVFDELKDKARMLKLQQQQQQQQ